MYELITNDGKDITTYNVLPTNLPGGTQVIERATGDILVFIAGVWQKMASTFSNDKILLVQSDFDRMLQELAIFSSIQKSEYFKLQGMRKSTDEDTRYLATEIVSVKHADLVSNQSK